MNPKQEIERLMEENRKLRIIAEMVLQFDLNGDIGDSLLFDPIESGNLGDWADWDEAWTWFYESRQKEEASSRRINDSSKIRASSPTPSTKRGGRPAFGDWMSCMGRTTVHSSKPKYWIALAKGTLGLGAHITNARLHVLDLMVEEAFEEVPRWWSTLVYNNVRDQLAAMIYLLQFAKKEHVTASEKQPMIWMFIDGCKQLIEYMPLPVSVEVSSEPKYVPTVGEIPF